MVVGPLDDLVQRLRADVAQLNRLVVANVEVVDHRLDRLKHPGDVQLQLEQLAVQRLHLQLLQLRLGRRARRCRRSRSRRRRSSRLRLLRLVGHFTGSDVHLDQYPVLRFIWLIP